MSFSHLLAQHPQLPYLAGAVAGGLVAIAALVRSALTRRSLRRRIGSLAVRLSDDPAMLDGHSLEAVLGHLERAAEHSIDHNNETEYRLARLAGALDAVPSGVVVADEHGGVRFRNAKAATYLEADSPTAARLRSTLGEVLASAAEGRSLERTIESSGPVPVVLAVRAITIDDGHRPVGSLAVIEDRSDARRLDEVRRDFVANAGDELRRPVLAIRALARLLTEEVGTRSSDARIALRIGEEAAAMDRTVDDLVELAQLESEPWRHPEAAPVSMIVDEAVGSVMALARRRKVSLQVAEVDSGAAVAGEPRQLAVALARLIENAVNHSGEHEVVTVEANAVGHRVDLVVRDQGVGVNDEDAERIFEPFYRGARSGEAAGAGLGLSVVRHVAARHGGTVLLDSRPGEGSAFVLRLPAA